MNLLYYSVDNPHKKMIEVKDSLRIGRGARNTLVLSSPFVAEEAAVLQKSGAKWEFQVLSLNAIYLNEKALYRGDRCEVTSEMSIRIPPFTIEFDLPAQVDDAELRLKELDLAALKLVQEVHSKVVKRLKPEYSAEARSLNDNIKPDELKQWEDEIERIALEEGMATKKNINCLDHLAGLAIRDRLLEQITSNVLTGRTSTSDSLIKRQPWSRLITSNANRENELENTCRHIATVLSTANIPDPSDQLTCVEQKGLSAWRKVMKDYHIDLKIYLANRYLKKQVKDMIFGYGPLEDLLKLPTITEIMVVDSNHIYVEKNGKIENSGRRFIGDEVTVAIIERIVSQVGRTIDRSRPLVDARLSDGSRVNAVIDPIAFSGPCLTIRKFPLRKLVIDDLVNRLKSLTQEAAEFLRAAVLSRKNILVSGGTGTGKTTLLNCLSDFIPEHERIVTIEDTVELRLNKEHVVQLETKDVNLEGKGAYTIRDLVRNSLRMRPDRIVVGECRGAEALDMLQAMNTGHDGSLSTIHANTSEDVILRLEVLVQMASDLPISSIHRQIGSAINLIVQLRRISNKRMVTQISEVIGVNPVTGGVDLRDIFSLDQHDPDASLLPTGHLPSFMGELISKNLIKQEIFYLNHSKQRRRIAS